MRISQERAAPSRAHAGRLATDRCDDLAARTSVAARYGRYLPVPVLLRLLVLVTLAMVGGLLPRAAASAAAGPLATGPDRHGENGAHDRRTYNVGGVTGARTTQAVFGPGGRVAYQFYPDHAVGSVTSTIAQYSYDDRGLPVGLAWWPAPGGFAARQLATQTRNVAGQVLVRKAELTGQGTVQEPWRTFSSTWAYDKLSRVASQTVADTSVQHARQVLTYHGLDDPKTLQHVMGASGAPTYDFTYGYDPRHQLTSVSEGAGKFSASYTFTPSGKLNSANVGGAAQAGSEVVNRNVTYGYTSPIDPEAPSALIPVGGGDNLRSYDYDSVGNLKNRRDGAPTASPSDVFVYDGDDQLRRASKYSGTALEGIEEYYYDHAGQRAAVVTRNASNAVTSVRMFMGDTELELDPATGGVQKAYAHLSLGTPVARIVSPAGGWTAGSGTSVTSAATVELMYQGLSLNTIVSVLPTGAVQSSFAYGPYGEVIQAGGTSGGVAAMHRRFNDKFKDDLTKLQYYGVRYYDGVMLGWTQADPLYRFTPDAAWVEPRKGNLYQFVLGNPLRYYDPDGRSGTATGAIAGGAVGGPVGAAGGAGVGLVVDGVLAVGGAAAAGYLTAKVVNLFRSGGGERPFGTGPITAGLAANIAMATAVTTATAATIAMSRPKDTTDTKATDTPIDTPMPPGCRPGPPATRPRVADRKLRNVINDNYKGTTYAGRTGSGTTADAIRHEIATGGKVQGRSHSQKGLDSIRAAEKRLRSGQLSPGDRCVAIELIRDLKDALNVK